MPLLQLLIVIAVFAVLLWLVQAYAPRPFSVILTVLLVLVLVVWTLEAFGLIPPLWTVRPVR